MMSAMGTKRKSSVHSASVSSWHKADISDQIPSAS